MERISAALKKHGEMILRAERDLWKTPETGYKEFKTSAYVAQKFEELGYTLTYAGDIPGFITRIETGRPGPEIMILGELDSVVCPSHPESDPVTGAVHSCGHHAQCAALLGIAAALKEPGMLDGLCGSIRLCAVPAEELIELTYRQGLIDQGKIKYFGGKVEFLHRGLFDGVDIAFMFHTAGSFYLRKGSVGILAKKVIYKGKAAHAGGAPHAGHNALYAATCGLNAVNALRETFREKDLIRFHPIITRGGDIVNAIPEQVEIETYVRGASFEGILDANLRINRALTGAALSMGCNVEIVDSPGYGPERNDPTLDRAVMEAVEALVPGLEVNYYDGIATGSTDMGDLSLIMPTVQPHCAGASGTAHGNDYYITDPKAACIDSAAIQLGMLRILLEKDGARAREVLANYQSPYTKESYLAFLDSLNRSGDRIEYGEDTVKISL